MARPGLKFSLEETAPAPFGPRRGVIVLERPNGNTISLQTPTSLTGTSRGLVPHLSRDHVLATKAIGAIHVPFETFLEQSPPVPTLYPGPNALHHFLRFEPNRHIVSLSVRDADDTREMPPNGNQLLNALCLRGVRKVSPADWTKYVRACAPDIAIALSDIPHIPPPFSQKRLTKSITRSTAWLAPLLAPNPTLDNPPPAIFVHLAGSASHPARAAFSASLIEPLNALEISAIGGLPTYDSGIAGYTIDLKPLRIAIAGALPSNDETQKLDTVPLLQTSLASLPPNKPRLVNGTTGPHDVLTLVRDVGIDIVETRWAIEAASHGVAFDFVFPVPLSKEEEHGQTQQQKELGHNFYDVRYRLDFQRFSGSFLAAAERQTDQDNSTEIKICPCIACSPIQPPIRIVHGSDPSEASDFYSTEASASSSSSSNTNQTSPIYNPPNTRSYIHHLLHTHEMSAHSLLVAHNLAVVDAFLSGIRDVLDTSGENGFKEEVRRFREAYSELEGSRVMEEARDMWLEVDRARGKGRLAREKEKRGDAGDVVSSSEAPVDS